MKRIKLPSYNYLGPAPFKKKTKYKKINKKVKLIDKNLITEDIANRDKLKQMFDNISNKDL